MKELEKTKIVATDNGETHKKEAVGEVQTALNYWLLENMKIMEELTVKEPVSWSEQDWGG